MKNELVVQDNWQEKECKIVLGFFSEELSPNTCGNLISSNDIGSYIVRCMNRSSKLAQKLNKYVVVSNLYGNFKKCYFKTIKRPFWKKFSRESIEKIDYGKITIKVKFLHIREPLLSYLIQSKIRLNVVIDDRYNFKIVAKSNVKYLPKFHPFNKKKLQYCIKQLMKPKIYYFDNRTINTSLKPHHKFRLNIRKSIYGYHYEIYEIKHQFVIKDLKQEMIEQLYSIFENINQNADLESYQRSIDQWAKRLLINSHTFKFDNKRRVDDEI